MRKYITITRGRKPTTAPTPPMMPSARRAVSSGLASARLSATKPWNVSIQATRVSAIYGPTQTWEIWNTRNMMPAKMGMPKNLLVRTASMASPVPFSRVRTFRVSTWDTS